MECRGTIGHGDGVFDSYILSKGMLEFCNLRALRQIIRTQYFIDCVNVVICDVLTAVGYFVHGVEGKRLRVKGKVKGDEILQC